MDVPSRAGPPAPHPRRGPLRAHALVVALALAWPAAQTVHAVDIYYARAIGQEYLPEQQAPSAPVPARTDEKPLPDLPGLGASAERQEAAGQGMSTWSKVLIGTVLVAAIAAIANNGGGGSAGVSVGTGDSPPPDPGTSGSGSNPGSNSGSGGEPGSGGGDPGNGGGIDIGIIPPVTEDNGGRGRGRDRNRDGDDD